MAEDCDGETDDKAKRFEPRLLVSHRYAEPLEDAQNAIDRTLLQPRGARLAEPSHGVRDSLGLIGYEGREIVHVCR